MRLVVTAEPIGDCHVGYRVYSGMSGGMSLALGIAGS